MLTAERMNCVTIVVLRTKMDDVLEEVARIGVLHPLEVEDVGDWASGLASAEGSRLIQEYAARRSRLRALVEEALPGAEHWPEPPSGSIQSVELGAVDGEIAEVEARLQPLKAARDRLIGRREGIQGMHAQLGILEPSGLPMASLFRSTYVATAMGRIPEPQLSKLQESLASIPSVVFPLGASSGECDVACVVLRKDRPALERALAEVGFKEAAAPQVVKDVSARVRTASAREADAVKAELAAAAKAYETAQTAAAPKVYELLGRVEATMLLLGLRSHCRLTEKTCVFVGWAPETETQRLTSAVTEKTGGSAIIEVTAPESIEKVQRGDLEVPVLFHRPAFLRPFAMIVEGFGVPSYAMIDPTIFVAATFLFMFGMMFGDVGHGLILFCLGLFAVLKAPGFRDIGKLALYCGVASMLFGFLYGSLFGLEDVLPAVWLRPLQGISRMFVVAVVFGIGVVSLGIVLNTLNALRAHTIWEALFETSGPLAGVFYWAALGFAARWMLASGRVHHAGWFLAAGGIPLVIFLLKGPILRVFGRTERAFPEGLVTYVMERAVETMDLFMSYLANTMSFIRVAAFGLAHAGLFVAVFTLADAVAHHPAGNVLWWLVVALGNVFIVVLEGVVVTIQALRLEYYEFFGKFFRGAGSRYKPVGYSELS